MSAVAVITGGSSGLGLQLACELYRRGMTVVLLARSVERLAAAQQVVQDACGHATSARVETRPCDVKDRDQLAGVFEALHRTHGRIDYLVVNAGTTTVDLLADHGSLDGLANTIEVNLTGAITTTYLGLRLLGRDSRLLFVSSGFGLVGCPGYSIYCASKGGLNLFAESMRRELKGRGVRVHLACPGDIDTPMYREELQLMPAWMRASMGRGKPLGADVAARRILDACNTGRFLVTTSGDVRLLQWVRKLLPAALSTWLIDRVLPVPPQPDAALAAQVHGNA